MGAELSVPKLRPEPHRNFPFETFFERIALFRYPPKRVNRKELTWPSHLR
jgi:hypothetical protein